MIHVQRSSGQKINFQWTASRFLSNLVLVAIIVVLNSNVLLRWSGIYRREYWECTLLLKIMKMEQFDLIFVCFLKNIYSFMTLKCVQLHVPTVICSLKYCNLFYKQLNKVCHSLCFIILIYLRLLVNEFNSKRRIYWTICYLLFNSNGSNFLKQEYLTLTYLSKLHNKRFELNKK